LLSSIESESPGSPRLLILIVAVLSILALAHAKGFAFSARHPPLWRAIIAVFTFHSNWLEARYGFLPANWNVMWSLSVEEMFYLFFPLVCVALLRLRHGIFPFIAVLLSFAVMGPFARTLWSNNEIWLEQSYLGGMDAIALGCLTALLTNYTESHQPGFRLSKARGVLGVLQAIGWSLIERE
jgi:peptidoglycan/LPS O-acetylase OafA/YrhL